jgi:hypothetical protein
MGVLMVNELTFTNSQGKEIVFTNHAPYILAKLQGMGNVDGIIQLQKAPFQDGSTLIDSILSERLITFEVGISVSNPQELSMKRTELASILNPRLGKGTLRYKSTMGTKEIVAVSDHVPTFPGGTENRGKCIQKAMVSLLCPSPYWMDISPTNIKLEDFVANFRFPFHFPVRFASRGDSRVLLNNGDVPTPIKVTFRGEALNPKITNITTGEFIRVNQQIPEGYSLVINTEFGNKEVKIVAPDGVEENAFHYIDLESTFFMLREGENRFSFITEGGRPEVYVEYKNRFVGV